MTASLRSVFTALGVACLLSAASPGSSVTAFAQAKQQQAPAQQPAPAQQQAPALKQIALTDKQLDGVLAAQKDMDAITEKLPENTAPDQKVIAQLEEVAKKHGFAGYDDYNNVVDNISLVIGGFDPATKKYVGPEAVIKGQIAQIQADKKMPAKEKKEALDELNQALKTPALQVENKGNIDLVAKYYDKLVAALGDDEN
ncbi:hypothetical protein [Bradyrhizobium sp. LMG 9283]|uniref:hypothetical protein n=1 Tax=Bradyrhizobium sp. LMG 9283 TaxID=592064 RepID=UPI00388F2A35